jgi:hypothetical protein
MKKPTRLLVETRNIINAETAATKERIAAVLAPYTGKKIVKFTPRKGWTAKIEPEIMALQNELHSRRFRLSFEFHHSWISAEVDVSIPARENDPDYGCQYVKAWFNACDLDGDTLEAVTVDCHSARTDYRYDEVIATIDRIEALKEEVSRLEKEVSYFI